MLKRLAWTRSISSYTEADANSQYRYNRNTHAPTIFLTVNHSSSWNAIWILFQTKSSLSFFQWLKIIVNQMHTKNGAKAKSKSKTTNNSLISYTVVSSPSRQTPILTILAAISTQQKKSSFHEMENQIEHLVLSLSPCARICTRVRLRRASWNTRGTRQIELLYSEILFKRST